MANVTKEYIIDIITKNLGTAIKELKTLDKAGQGVEKSTKAMNAEAAKAHSIQEGLTAGATNTTRAFQKQIKGLGGGATGLIQLYGGLAANAFAVTAAFRALSAAADYQNQIKAAEDYGLRTGQSLLTVARGMKEVTGEAISMSAALRHASITASAGFDSSQIIELTKVAKGASLALGRNLSDSLERVFKGAVKAEPELLDELGIILRLKPATEAYAEELGKTASSLTTFEKQQAVLNEVLRQGQEKFGEMSDELEVTAYDKLSTSFADLAANVLGFVNILATPLVESFSSNIVALGAAVGLFATKIITLALPSLREFGSTAIASVITPVTNMATKFRGLANSMSFIKTDALFDDIFVSSILKAGKAVTQSKNASEEYLVQLSSLPDVYSKAYKATNSHASAMKAVTKEADRLGNAYGVSIVETDKVIRSTEKLVLTEQKVAAGHVKTTMSLTGLTTAEKIYSIVTNKAARWTDAFAASLTSMSAAASLGGMLGITKMWKVLKSADAAGAITTMKGLGIAFVDAEGKANGLSTVVESMYSKFGRLTRGVGLFAGAVSTLFKAIPIIGQLFLAFELLSMIISPIGKLFGIISEENDKAEKSMDSFSKTVSETTGKLISLEGAELKLSTGLEDTTSNLKRQQNILQDLNASLKTVITDISKASGIDTGFFDFTGVDLEDFESTLQGMNNQLIQLGASKKEVDALFNAFKESNSIAGASLALEAYNNKIQELRASKAAIIEHNESVLNLAESLNSLATSAKITDESLQSSDMVKFAEGMRAAANEAANLGAVDLTNLLDGLQSSLVLLSKATATDKVSALSQKLSKITADMKSNSIELRQEMEKRGITAEFINSKSKEQLTYLIKQGVWDTKINELLAKKLNLENDYANTTKSLEPLQRARLNTISLFVEKQEALSVLQKEQESSLAAVQAMATNSTASFQEKINYMTAELGIKGQLLEIEREQLEISTQGNTLALEQRQLEIRTELSRLLSGDLAKNAEKISLLNAEHANLIRTQEVYDRLATAQQKALDAKGAGNYNSFISSIKTGLEAVYASLLKGNDQWAKLDFLLSKIGQAKGLEVINSIFTPLAETAQEELASLSRTLTLWKDRVAAIQLYGKTMKELGPVAKADLDIQIEVLSNAKSLTDAQKTLLETLKEKKAVIEETNEAKRLADVESKAIAYAKSIHRSTVESRLKFDILRAQTAEQAAQIELELYLVSLGVEHVANEKQILKYLKEQYLEKKRQQKVTSDEKALKAMRKKYQDTIDDIGEAFGDMFNAAWEGGREGFRDYMNDLKKTLIKTFFDLAGKLVVNAVLNLSGGSGKGITQGGVGGTVQQAGSGIDSIASIGSTISSVVGITSSVMAGVSEVLGFFGAVESSAFAAGVSASLTAGTYMASLASAWSTAFTSFSSFGTALIASIPVIGWAIAAISLIGSLAGWFDDAEAPTKIHMQSGAVGDVKSQFKSPDTNAYGESIIGAIRFGIQHTGKDGQLSDEEAKQMVDEVLQPLINLATAIDNALVEYAQLDTEQIAALTELTTESLDRKAEHLKNMNPDQFLKERLEIILENIGGSVTELHSIFKNLEDMSKYNFAQMSSYAGALLVYAQSIGEQKNIFTTLINETATMKSAFADLQQEGEPLIVTILRVGAQLYAVNTIFDSLGWEAYNISAAGAAAADGFIKMSGGLDQLMGKINFYIQQFFSIGEQLKMNINGLVNTFGNSTLGDDALFQITDFPKTRSEFRKLMDEGDEAQRTFLLNNAASFDAYYDALEGQQNANDDVTDSANGGAASTEALSQALKDAQKVYQDLERAVTSLIGSIEDDIKDIQKSFLTGPSLSELADQVYSDLDTTDTAALQERVDLAQQYHDLIISTMEEQIDALNEQLDIVKALQDSGQDLLDLVHDLRSNSNYTTRTVNEQFKAALSEYKKLLRSATEGDQGAIGALEDLVPSLLDLAKQFYGGTASADYESLFNDITLGLEDLGTTLIELSTEDILTAIEVEQKKAVERLTKLSSWLSSDMLPTITSALNAINSSLNSISSNTASSASSGINMSGSLNSIDFDIGTFLNSAIANWTPPMQVELVDQPEPPPDTTIIPDDLDETNDIISNGFTAISAILQQIASNTDNSSNPLEPLGFAMGGIATSPSIFAESGPEAAVPLPDGRTIPVTVNSPIIPNTDISDLVRTMREMQQENIAISQELTETVEDLKDEVANLKHTVGEPIVETIKESNELTTFKLR